MTPGWSHTRACTHAREFGATVYMDNFLNKEFRGFRSSSFYDVEVSCVTPVVKDLTRTLTSLQTLEQGSMAFKSSFVTFLDIASHCVVQKLSIMGTSKAPKSLFCLPAAVSCVSEKEAREASDELASFSPNCNPAISDACSIMRAKSDATT